MAWAAIALAIVGTVMQVQGMKKAEAAEERAGQQGVINSEFEAQQLEQDATQAYAASQRVAMDERHKADLVASRAIAVAGSSGGGVLDPTVVGLLTDITGEGAYRSATALYEGEEKARRLNLGAAAARLEGQSRQMVGYGRAAALRSQAMGTILSSGSSLYAKYGGRGPSTTTVAAGGSLSSGSWIDAGTPEVTAAA